jgi:hypothetical protein
MNFPYQMEPFETNIYHFGGLNRCRQYFSLSTTIIRLPLSILSQLWTKNITKMNFCTKIKFEKK